MYWACARTEVQREAVAERHLGLAGFTTYVPRLKVERHIARANGHAHPVSATVPLFPSYLFVSIIDRWYSIGSTIGVVHVLTDGEHPARVPDRIIGDLRGREGVDGLIQLPTPPLFQRGERVRIIRGALRGQIAIFQDMKPKERIEVLLSILGAERQLELARRDVLRAK
jgi:transcriptional antiterminator RfaH